MTALKTTKLCAKSVTLAKPQENTDSAARRKATLATLRRQMATEGVTVGREADGRIYIMKQQGSNAGVVKAAIKHRHKLAGKS